MRDGVRCKVEEATNHRMLEVGSTCMAEKKGGNRAKRGGSCMENSFEW